MIAKLAVLASALAMPFLCLQCITSHAPVIQESLRASTVTALDEASVKGVKVGVDGRDVVLQGMVATEAIKTQAGTVAMMLPGVRTVDNQLTVAPSTAVVQTKLNDILLKKKIEFQSGMDVILPISTPVLEEALAVLRQAPQISVTINGHTDSQGDAVYNKALSARRAKAVATWFQNQGIDASRLASAGYGDEKPIDSNDREAGRAKNRRVEILANSAIQVGGK